MLCNACGPANHPEANQKDSTAIIDTNTVKELPMEAKILGTYKGDFGGSAIYLTINYCSGHKIAGYNTHKGLRRNVSGTIAHKGNKWEIQLSEPGDHEFDGIFSLVMDTSLSKASGSWKPAGNKSLAEKRFTITKLNTDDGSLGYFAGDHCDMDFSADGTCTLNYYDKLNDSTFSGQMNTLRGTWEQQAGKEIIVNWQSNGTYGKQSTTFIPQYETLGESLPYIAGIKGDDFELSAEM
jgi:hypothetical protein